MRGGGNVSEHGVKLAFFYTTTLDEFLFNIIVNFEIKEILRTLIKKVGRGLRGSGPYSKRISRRLTHLVLRYGITVENIQGIFLNFLIIFRFSLYTHLMCPTRG